MKKPKKIIKRIKKFLKKITRKRVNVRRKPWPTKEEIEALPYFEGLGLDQIIDVLTPEGAKRAYDILSKEKIVGFDTESKPVFKKGQTSTGPHVVQFSTQNQAFIFILHDPAITRAAGDLIHLKSLKKVGFGLDDDIKRARSKLHVSPLSVVDVEYLFAKKGYGRGVGVKVGVAIALKKRFRKSKKASTSNWSRTHLADSQLLYAANDAYAALKVFQALK